MISVDTNVVVRLLTADDQQQYRKARMRFRGNEIFIPETVILETQWVLRYAYHYSREEIFDSLTKLFGLPNVRLSNPKLISQTLTWYQSGLDFADALHLAVSQNCSEMFSFDKDFVKKSKGLCDCQVRLA